MDELRALLETIRPLDAGRHGSRPGLGRRALLSRRGAWGNWKILPCVWRGLPDGCTTLSGTSAFWFSAGTTG